MTERLFDILILNEGRKTVTPGLLTQSELIRINRNGGLNNLDPVVQVIFKGKKPQDEPDDIKIEDIWLAVSGGIYNDN